MPAFGGACGEPGVDDGDGDAPVGNDPTAPPDESATVSPGDATAPPPKSDEAPAPSRDDPPATPDGLDTPGAERRAAAAVFADPDAAAKGVGESLMRNPTTSDVATPTAHSPASNGRGVVGLDV